MSGPSTTPPSSGEGMAHRGRRGRYHSGEGGRGAEAAPWGLRDQDNLNTIRKTRFDLELVKSFLRSVNEKRSVHEIPPVELDPLLASFIGSVKKKNGEDFEPGTLRGILGSVDRYFRKHNYGHAIFSGNVKDFPRTRDALATKQRQLKREGRGNHPNRAQPITNEEVEVLYLTGQLGTGSPDALLNTVWFNNWVYFGLRGMKVHRHLRWGDIVLCRLDAGGEYLEYVNGQSKAFRPRVYALPDQPDRDPVAAYKLYTSKRPRPMLSPDAPFYLAPNSRKPNYSDAWFKCQAAGENRLGRLMKTMVVNAGLPEKKRIAYKSITGHLVKESDRPSPSSSVTLHNGLSHLHDTSVTDITPIPLSLLPPCPLLPPDSLRGVPGDASHSGVVVNLDVLDLATRQLWNHFKVRGGFTNDRDFVLHLLRREQSCTDCGARNQNGSPRPGSPLWSTSSNKVTMAITDRSATESNGSIINGSSASGQAATSNGSSDWEEGPPNVPSDLGVNNAIVSEAVTLFKEWLQEKNLSTDFEKFSKCELNDLLCQYYKDVSQEYGSEYTWQVLDNIRASLQRYLSSPPRSRTIDLVRDSKFHTSNSILRGFVKRRRLDDTNQSPAPSGTDRSEVGSQLICPSDLAKIHSSPLLCSDNPEGLLHKVWFDVSLFFGVPCGENPLRSSLRFLRDREDDASTEHFALETGDRDISPTKMYRSQEGLCPVSALKLYLSRLHPDQEHLFQHPQVNWNPDQTTWYSNEPMSRDDLESIADFLFRSTGLSQCYGLSALQATSDWLHEAHTSWDEKARVAGLTSATTEDEESRDAEILTTETALHRWPDSMQESPKSKGERSTTNPMLLLPTSTEQLSLLPPGLRLGSMLLPSMPLLPVTFPPNANPLPPGTVMYLKSDPSTKPSESQDLMPNIT